jgi:DNA-binding HxlR family transcriptional regulator
LSTASKSRATTADNPGGRGEGAAPAVGDAVERLDEVIHQKVRLGILSTLLATGEADFKLLKETLGLSDGNLSTHLAVLDEHGYILVRKEFRGKRPHTTVKATDQGREAFQQYLLSLERIIKAARG